MESIHVLDDKKIDLKILREKGYQLSKKDWFEILRGIVYGEVDQSSKINFQNIKSILGIFKGYFDINLNLDENEVKRLHLYYQTRHILVHNVGKIDERYIKNLRAASIAIDAKIGSRIVVSEKAYNRCKATFTKFFECLENSIAASNVTYSSVIT